MSAIIPGGSGQNWKGEYNPATTYQANDAVSYNGSSFLCTATTTGVAPVPDTVSWMIPPLATTGSMGSIAALPVADQTKYFARGDNTWQLFQTAEPRLSRNHLAGLTIANNVSDAVNDLDISEGECRDSANSADIVLSTGLTKRLDAVWAAGTNQGGRDTGTIADATWHIFAIGNPTTKAVDVLFSQSLSSPTMPSGFTQKRRIGSMVRHVTNYGGWAPITQLGDYFHLRTARADVNGGTIAPGASIPVGLPSCPVGIRVYADVQYNVSSTVATNFFLCVVGQGVTIPTLVVPTANFVATGQLSVWTSTTAQVQMAQTVGAANITVSASVMGYRDPRGRDSYYG